jgi:hypothetical protein
MPERKKERKNERDKEKKKTSSVGWTLKLGNLLKMEEPIGAATSSFSI